jgi:hypothetical protein
MIMLKYFFVILIFVNCLISTAGSTLVDSKSSQVQLGPAVFTILTPDTKFENYRIGQIRTDYKTNYMLGSLSYKSIGDKKYLLERSLTFIPLQNAFGSTTIQLTQQNGDKGTDQTLIATSNYKTTSIQYIAQDGGIQTLTAKAVLPLNTKLTLVSVFNKSDTFNFATNPFKWMSFTGHLVSSKLTEDTQNYVFLFKPIDNLTFNIDMLSGGNDIDKYSLLYKLHNYLVLKADVVNREDGLDTGNYYMSLKPAKNIDLESNIVNNGSNLQQEYRVHGLVFNNIDIDSTFVLVENENTNTDMKVAYKLGDFTLGTHIVDYDYFNSILVGFALNKYWHINASRQQSTSDVLPVYGLGIKATGIKDFSLEFSGTCDDFTNLNDNATATLNVVIKH